MLVTVAPKYGTKPGRLGAAIMGLLPWNPKAMMLLTGGEVASPNWIRGRGNTGV